MDISSNGTVESEANTNCILSLHFATCPLGKTTVALDFPHVQEEMPPQIAGCSVNIAAWRQKDLSTVTCLV